MRLKVFRECWPVRDKGLQGNLYYGEVGIVLKLFYFVSHKENSTLKVSFKLLN